MFVFIGVSLNSLKLLFLKYVVDMEHSLDTMAIGFMLRSKTN